MFFAVSSVRDCRCVQNYVGLFVPHKLGHRRFIGGGQHPFRESAQFIPACQLRHNACPHKAACTGNQHFFHQRFSLQNYFVFIVPFLRTRRKHLDKFGGSLYNKGT